MRTQRLKAVGGYDYNLIIKGLDGCRIHGRMQVLDADVERGCGHGNICDKSYISRGGDPDGDLMR